MLSLLRKTGYTLYRIWFYFLAALPIILLFPILILLIISERTYGIFFWLARNLWANLILYGMGFPPRITYDEHFQPGQSYILVGNHTSELDVMLMLRTAKYPFVFVGKKELKDIPIFGYLYKRVCILVDRSDSRSRGAVYESANERLSGGMGVCIFPEGGVPPEEVILDEFKDGSFKLAIIHGIPIVPITFFDCKKRFSFKFFSGSPGPLRVRVHKFIPTKEMTIENAEELKNRVRQIILTTLLADSDYSTQKPENQ